MTPLIDIHTHRLQPEKGVLTLHAVRLPASPPEEGFYSAGVHPWDVLQATEEWLSALASADARLAAIGECGLDYKREGSPATAKQKAWFARQIAWANELKKPLIVHSVGAVDDTLEALRSSRVPVIIHGFTGSPQAAARFISPGCYLSFGARTMASEKTQEALRSTPPERIFLETDDGIWSIRRIYDFAAEMLGMTVEELATLIRDNYKTVFNR